MWGKRFDFSTFKAKEIMETCGNKVDRSFPIAYLLKAVYVCSLLQVSR